MTTRTLALAVALLCASRAGAQLIKVPSLDESRRPLSVSVHAGFLQTQDRFDGQSGAQWYLGEAMQYRAALELGTKSGSLALVGSVADVPIARSGGSATGFSDGTIQLRQYLAAFRTPETEGAHQIVDVGLGLSQWTAYSGTDALTADERKARNAFTLVVGYGFGFTLGSRAAFNLVQDVSTLWGSSEGLPSGRSRMVRQYTTRVGVRVMLRGRR
ncbi:MAG: hypothetical protein K8S21_03565 [Gemmatimonadetes bacterium]|nr:hypothetical protein [Gemmatimonadota bacterium]